MRILLSLAAAALIFIHGSAQAAGDIEAGKVKSATCAACHGADGNSPNGAFPILAGQYQDYLIQAMRDYRSGKRKNPIMSGLAAPLSDQDHEDLAAYFSSQKSSLYTPKYADE